MMSMSDAERREMRLDDVEGPIHFMGIAGAGMYALAELMAARGHTVTGCDVRESAAVARLRSLGIDVEIGHDPAHVVGAGAVVVTAAVPADHPELVAARSAGIPVWKRAVALGMAVSSGRVAAIAGTHGKTSTTAATVRLLVEAGLDPTGLVGGTVAQWDGNLRMGGDLYVVEADEYDRSFHHLAPDVAVVTNLEADHLEIYGSLAGVREGFHTFLAGLREGGRAIVCADDPGASALLPRLGDRGYTYGTSAGSQLRADEIRTGPEGTRFRVFEEGEDRGTFHLPQPGRHTLLNALAAAAVARWFGAEWTPIRRGWAAHRGVERRFDRLGERAGIEIIDDYAHHPTEIATTLAAVRDAFPSRRVVAVFQPHLYTRTRDFAGEFGRALAAADVVWVTEIFPAREQPIEGVDHHLIVDEARRAGADVHVHADLDTLHDAVAATLRPGDVVIGMGAGSIERFGPCLHERLEEVVHA
jgi:UDP-N-acetylmuramate--alanine ligase